MAIVAFRLAGRGFGQSVLGAWGTVGEGPVRFASRFNVSTYLNTGTYSIVRHAWHGAESLPRYRLLCYQKYSVDCKSD